MSESIFGTIILIITLLFSYQGFRDSQYFDKYAFRIDPILKGKEYFRMISSGFLHVGWFHLVFNMIALVSFSEVLEWKFGVLLYALMYFASMFGGSLLSLYIHRNHGDYSAVGASGAVSGVIASFIILYPNLDLQFIFIPIDIPAWIMGILFIGVSIVGIKTQLGNIGHDAHLGGALIGILFTLIYDPSVAIDNWWIVALLLVPTLIFLYLIIQNPNILLLDNYWGEAFSKRNFKNPLKQKSNLQNPFKSQKGGRAPKSKQEELDEILDKIKRTGFRSLTTKERERLKKLRDEM